ncbi:MAG: DUF4249 domain-containing protein [Bacteroidota bacterium]|nr:DUF4249 domain-containing protein [Bacteroidota bacterium]
MKNYLFIASFILLILTACTEKIDVKLPNSDKKVVIEGTIENGKFAQVIITRSIGLFSNVEGTTFNDFYIFDAEVYVSDGVQTDTLTLTIDSSSSLGVVYQGNTIVGTSNQQYSLIVKVEGVTYTATTFIPTPVALDSVWWKAQPPEDTLGYANAHLSEPSGTGNNYRWYAKRPMDRRFIAPFGATFDDKYVDGVSFDFAYTKGYDPTDTENTFENDSARGFYLNTDTIYIKFCSINKETREFYSTLENALSNNGNPFASPVTILGNISGGALGVWGGFGASYDTILPTP